MDCIRSQELMSLALDNELDQNEQVLFDQHLNQCPDCREEFALYQSMIQDLKQTPEAELPDGFHDNLMQRINEDKVVPFRKRFNYKQLNIAAMLVMVVVFALVGVNNLSDMNQGKMEETMVMEETTESMDMDMEAVVEESKESAEPAMMMEEPAAEMATEPMADDDVAEEEAGMDEGEVAVAEAEMTTTEEANSESDDGNTVTTTMSESQSEDAKSDDAEPNAKLSRNADDENLTAKLSENELEKEPVISLYADEPEEVPPNTMNWLWFVFATVAVATGFMSILIIRMKK